MHAFDLNGKTAVVLGGAGVLGRSLALGLSHAGADVAVCDIREGAAMEAARACSLHCGAGVRAPMARGYQLDATDKLAMQRVCAAIAGDFGTIDVLVNAVGGNMKRATTSDDAGFFDLPEDAIRAVVDLNLMAGAILPSQVFGRVMAGNPHGGSIINISSMNALRPLTRIPAYSAAKAAVSNFAQWLAVELARSFGDKLRVNAIAPGFFLTEQNRYLLTAPETGELTDRGRLIVAHTPMGRFGDPEELVGTLIWLASGASRFVTGIVVPVDGGFSAYSGV